MFISWAACNLEYKNFGVTILESDAIFTNSESEAFPNFFKLTNISCKTICGSFLTLFAASVGI